MGVESVVAVLGGSANEFESLLTALLSSSNEERGRADALFEECKGHPSALVLKLVNTLHSSPQQHLRSLCAVLLRKVLTKGDYKLWTQLTPDVQNSIKAQMLLCVEQESIKDIRNKLCDTVAELAAGVLQDGQWPELLPFMFRCVSSGDANLRESALFIFAQLAQYIAPTLLPHLDALVGVFHQNLLDAMGLPVRVASLKATMSLVQSLDSKQDRDKFQGLIPAMMDTLQAAIQGSDEVVAQDALEMFIEVAGTEPRFLRRHLANVVHSMLQVAEARQLDEGIRHLAVEFVVTLAEARDRAPGMMRKLPNFVPRLFSILVHQLLEVEDDPAWSTSLNDDDEQNSSDFEVAQECLDRLAIALGGNTVLPVASQLLPPLMADSLWQKRHAALVVLSQIAEGCSKLMGRNLGAVVGMILMAFSDPHPRVRWAACNAIGQLCTDLGPDLQEQHHHQIMPKLLAAMEDKLNPRVQAHAAAAVLNFSDSAPPAVLAPYLDALVTQLLTLLQSGHRMLQEGALTSLAAVADCSGELFQRYYPAVMPVLKHVLASSLVGKELRMLRARSIECISLVGMAVGKDKFQGDAKEVMDTLLQLQQAGGEEEDDPTTSYMLQAWARLCRCLGAEFLPYLSVVMPPLLRSAKLKADVKITDAEEEDEEDEEGDDSIESMVIGDKRIQIRTSVLEEKATACNMLLCYCDELKEGFFPYVEEVAALMVPLLTFYFHEEVRRAAVSAMPDLLTAAKLAVEKGVAGGAGPAYVKQLCDYLVDPLVAAVAKEPDAEICGCMLEALADCVVAAGTLLGEAQVGAVVEQLLKVGAASKERRKDREQRTHAEDFDEEEKEAMEEENEAEDYVIEQVGEVVEKLISTFKQSAHLVLEPLLVMFRELTNKEHSSCERRVAICVFDQLAEHVGPTDPRVFSLCIPLLLDSSTDTHAEVRQAALYGIGVCAVVGGTSFAPYVNDALARLSSVMGAPNCRGEDNEAATDNAVSALGKIVAYQEGVVDVAQLLPRWLAYLPMRNDKEEAAACHLQLANLLETSNPHLLGPNNEHLPHLISVCVEVITAGTQLATGEVVARLTALLRQLHADVLTQWCQGLPARTAVITKILAASPAGGPP